MCGSLTLCLHAREFVGVRVRVCVRGWSVAFSPILFGGGEPYKRAGGCVWQKAAEGGPLAVRSTTTAAVGIVRGEDRSTNTYMSESYRQGIRGLRSVCISTKSHDLQVPGIPWETRYVFYYCVCVCVCTSTCTSRMCIATQSYRIEEVFLEWYWEQARDGSLFSNASIFSTRLHRLRDLHCTTNMTSFLLKNPWVLV